MIRTRDVWDVCCNDCGKEIAIGIEWFMDAEAEEERSTVERNGIKEALCPSCAKAAKNEG